MSKYFEWPTARGAAHWLELGDYLRKFVYTND